MDSVITGSDSMDPKDSIIIMRLKFTSKGINSQTTTVTLKANGHKVLAEMHLPLMCTCLFWHCCCFFIFVILLIKF